MNGVNRQGLNAFSVFLVLTVAIFALILAKPSLIAASQSPYLHQSAPIPVGEVTSSGINQSVLVSLHGEAPVPSRVNCASCHCDPRSISNKYPAHSTEERKPDTLTLQDFVKESQTVPLLVRQSPVFCASGHTNQPGDKGDTLIDFLQPQGKPGT